MDDEDKELARDHGPALDLLPGQASGISLLNHQPGWFTQFLGHSQEVQGGIEIMRTLYHHARFAFDPNGLQGYNDAKTILNFIQHNYKHANLDEISSREIQQNIRGINKDRANIALSILERHNYIRQWHGPKKQHVFIVHKDAYLA